MCAFFLSHHVDSFIVSIKFTGNSLQVELRVVVADVLKIANMVRNDHVFYFQLHACMLVYQSVALLLDEQSS